MTFTLLAADPARGLLGVVTASRSLAVGASVPAIVPGVGAAASQSWTNPRLRGLLLRELEAGRSPDEAIAGLPAWDEELPLRQVAVLDAAGRSASFTGADCSGWAGEHIGQHAVAIGNLLTGPEVLDAMIAALTAPVADAHDPAIAFARRMLAALDAGERAGGDRRGRQSAALQVAVATDADDVRPPRLAVDLRSDHDDRPIARLGELLDVREREATPPAD
jgi:Uncharacterized conserved protein